MDTATQFSSGWKSYLGQSLTCLHDLPAEPAAPCCDNGHMALHTFFLLHTKKMIYEKYRTLIPGDKGQLAREITTYVVSWASEREVPTQQIGLGLRKGTHLTQHELHITELAALPQPPIVFMQRALGITGELQEKTQVLP